MGEKTTKGEKNVQSKKKNLFLFMYSYNAICYNIIYQTNNISYG